MKIHPPGTRFGQFEVINYPVISDVSVNYTCFDHERSCPTGLKALRSELLSSRMARDYFEKAGATWTGLGTHPHIVRCHNVLKPENSDEVYLVLQTVVPDKISGTSSLLSWFVPGTPLPVLQALLFALQIARGMRFVANQLPGFVYSDLKPENVLVSGGRLSQADVNRLRITDIGLAAVLLADDLDLPSLLKIDKTSFARTQVINGVVGTPLFMSPEQWRGETAGTATDVYAFGCILYRMLVGRHPVAGQTLQALNNDHSTGNVRPLPASLPEVVLNLTSHCLALEPRERYQSWEDVVTAIAVAYESTTNYPIPMDEPIDAPTESERAQEGWFVNAMGCVSLDTGRLDTAVECIEHALKVGYIEGDKSLVGSATNSLGLAICRQGDAQRAVEYHKKALTIGQEIGDQSVEGSALNNLGIANLQLGNPRQAIGYLEKALELAREIGDRKGEMSTLVNMGSVYHQLGDLRSSIQYYEQELVVARKIRDRRGESAALANLGSAYSDLGDDRRAIQYQEQSLAIKTEIGERHARIASLNNLGNAYRNLGNAQRAFEYYNEALQTAREMGDRRGEAFALNNMGSTYSNLGEMERALKHHEQALEIFREINDRRSQGDCLTNLGLIYMNRHDTVRAVEVSEQAIKIDREVGDMLGLALDSFNMANLLAQQDRFHEALPYAEESANILEKVGHPDKAPQARQLVISIRAEIDRQSSRTEGIATVAPSDLNQQILKVRQDNPELTADMSDEDIALLLQQADLTVELGKSMTFHVQRPDKTKETLDQPDPAVMSAHECGVYGEKLLLAGQWFEAERFFLSQLEKAKQEYNPSQQALAYTSLGNIYGFRGNGDQALLLYHHALSLAEQIDDLRLCGGIYNDMGEVYRRQGDYLNAITFYNKSLEIATTIGNEESLAAGYGNLGIVYKNQGDFEQAIKAYEKSLEYSRRQGIDRLTANQYGNLGVVFGLKGQYTKAIEFHEKGLEICLRLGNQKSTADAYGNLGIAYIGIGNYPAARKMCQNALEIMKNIPNEPGMALIYGNLGFICQSEGDAEQAIVCYKQGLAVLERIGDKHNSAKFYNNLGLLYYGQGRSIDARVYLMKAKKLYETVGDDQAVWKTTQEIKRI